MMLSIALRSYRDRALALSARERSLVLLVIAVGLFFILDAVLISPQSARRQERLNAEAFAQAQLEAMRAELARLRPESDDVLARQVRQLTQLRSRAEQLEAISASIKGEQPKLRSLVTAVLKSEHPRVALVSLKTLPVKAMVSPASGAQVAAGLNRSSPLYRHGINVEVKGRYLDLLAFVQSLEVATTGALWSDLQLTTRKYPDSTLLITLYLLSDQPHLNLS